MKLTKEEKQEINNSLRLTQENYYTPQANEEYMSTSQFKDFLECEQHALCKLAGSYVEEKSKAMLVGSYVDAFISQDLDTFRMESPQIFKRDGTLLKDFEKAEEIIRAIENDQVFMKYLGGEHQVIMTGTIQNVKFKIKVDSLLPNAIVDLKVMSSIKELVWVEKDGRNVRCDFVEAYGYDIQGAIYQEIVRQNTGKKLPFILAVVSKEEEPDKELIQIDQYYLDKALELVKEHCEHFDLVKQGIVVPNRCGKCPSCRKLKEVKEPISYQDFFGKEIENE